nr:uncharacterized protein LOC106622155 isoform X1 [Bactrocera oleae]
MIKILIVLVAFISSYQSCSGEQSGHVNFWYTCDFQMESDMNAMSEECRKIYSQKASKSDVYELYKTEAEMFYKFRNKLVECESNGKICALSDNQNELEMPLLIGYDINKRMRLYKEAEMNQCYVETTNNIEFIKCIIETRRKLLAALNQNCSSIHHELYVLMNLPKLTRRRISMVRSSCDTSRFSKYVYQPHNDSSARGSAAKIASEFLLDGNDGLQSMVTLY